MHIKRIHEMIEKLTECTKMAIENDKTSVGVYPISDVMDMIKDLSEAEYYSRISKAMEEADKEEEEEIKYIMKKMKEEGEDWNEDDARRFYRGQSRSKTSGRFMRRGDGRKNRGYEEPMYYGGMPEIYNPMEYMRDMDRMDRKMYYSSNQSTGGNSNNQSGQSNGMGGNVRGYSDGYSDGLRDGSRNNQRDSREGRSGRNRRNYMETKEMNKGNSPEEKQKKMKELEDYTKSLSEDVADMINDATPEEKALLKQKLQVLAQKV